uniref:Peptidase S1 domain-containing protein n=1 Tax=Glossina brevipalpis TaxID=37001 RepID=A0A1A9WGZ3_9MUSC
MFNGRLFVYSLEIFQYYQNFSLIILLIARQISIANTNCIEDPTKLESPSEFLKHIIWGNNNDDVFVGVLLSNNVVLTPLLLFDKANIVYKEMYSIPFIDSTNSVHYGHVVYMKNFVLLRLMINLDLIHGQKKITMLPKKEFTGSSECVAVTLALFKPIIVDTNVIVTKEKCKEQICIKLNSCITNHCEHFSSGAILVCNNTLTGVISPTNIEKCDRSQPLAVASIFKELKMIEYHLDQLSTMSLISRYAKYLVYFGWKVDGDITIQGMGVILTRNMILTHYAPDMSNPKQPFRNINDEIIQHGFIVYGVTQFTWYPDISITWNKTKNYAKVTDLDITKIQLAMIMLNKDLYLDGKQVANIPLHSHVIENVEEGSTCIVPVFQRTNDYPIRDKEYEIVDRASCNNLLLHLNERNKSYVCIKEDCDHLIGGAPLICYGQLTGIVSAKKPCNINTPRICVLVSSYTKWIHFAENKLSASNRISNHIQFLLFIFIYIDTSSSVY